MCARFTIFKSDKAGQRAEKRRRLTAERGPGESYSEVIIRLAKGEGGEE